MNDLLLRACRRERVPRPPVWLMRQAGRSLPEYRALRTKYDFLTLVHTPELAAEVTLQPVERLRVDAAIIFSDILVVPQAMGMALTVEEGVGPRFPNPIRATADIERLGDPMDGGLDTVLDAVRHAALALKDTVPLIGFAGAPWTLASYMVEGGGSKQFATIKRLLVEQPEAAHRLLDRVSDAVARFIAEQVNAGAEVVQLFDSWAGALTPRDYREFGLPYLARCASAAKDAGVPVIVFALGAGWALEALALETNADVIGVDWHTEAVEARTRLAKHPVALQGNLDPSWLYAAPEEIASRTRRMIREFGPIGHIANLGHGILPDVSVEHAKAFVDTVREWRWDVGKATAAS